MEKCYGNYLGLVVNEQDPEGRDRVQIYVPGVTNTIYDNWNNNNTNKSIGIDIGSTFTLNEEILRKLRSVLPWAEKATPLIGPGTSMYHQEGRGASSAPIESSSSSDTFVPVASNNPPSVFTGDNIDGYPTTGLDPTVKNLLPSFKEVFPNSTITSTVRTYNKTTGQVIGANGNVVKGSSAGSLHNAEKDNSGNYTKLSRAIDINMPLSPSEQERIVQWWIQNGATEIGWEGDHIHVGFRRDDKKNTFYRDSNGQIRTDLSGSPSWFQTIGEQFKKGQIQTFKEDGNYPIVAEIPATSIDPDLNGLVSGTPDIPYNVGPSEGMPQGTRSTTRTLSKVWLFFYGGDIQKPVFFAYSLPPNETRAHNNIPENTSTTSVSNTDSIGNGVSGDTNPADVNPLPVSTELTYDDGDGNKTKFINIEESDGGIYIGTLDGSTDKYELTIINNFISSFKQI